MDKVFIRSVGGYEEDKLFEVVEYILSESGIDGLVKPGSRVVLKANLMRAASPEEAVTTHPAVVSAVIAAIKRRGAGEIIIADSPSGAFSLTRLNGIYEACGMAALLDETVKLNRNLKSSELEISGCPPFETLDVLKEADAVISVGKLKSQAMMGMTLAVKNMFGAVPGVQKSEKHCMFPDKDRFARMICELCLAVKPDISILDAVVGMEGDGPAAGTPVKLGFVIGGKNPFYVDRAAIEAVGVAVSDAQTVAASVDMGLAPRDISDIEIEGDTELISRPVTDFKLPATRQGVAGGTGFYGKIRSAVSKRFAPYPRVEKSGCVGCGRCAEICPQNTIVFKNKLAEINTGRCIRCYCCHEACPENTIELRKNLLFRMLR